MAGRTLALGRQPAATSRYWIDARRPRQWLSSRASKPRGTATTGAGRPVVSNRRRGGRHAGRGRRRDPSHRHHALTAIAFRERAGTYPLDPVRTRLVKAHHRLRATTLAGTDSSGELPDRRRALGGRLERLPRAIAECHRLAADRPSRHNGTEPPPTMTRAPTRRSRGCTPAPSSAHLAALRTSPSDTPASTESGRELGVRADDRHSSDTRPWRLAIETLASARLALVSRNSLALHVSELVTVMSEAASGAQLLVGNVRPGDEPQEAVDMATVALARSRLPRR
jgi:hypothetical protein